MDRRYEQTLYRNTEYVPGINHFQPDDRIISLKVLIFLIIIIIEDVKLINLTFHSGKFQMFYFFYIIYTLYLLLAY